LGKERESPEVNSALIHCYCFFFFLLFGGLEAVGSSGNKS